jgi:hypothetical protein
MSDHQKICEAGKPSPRKFSSRRLERERAELERFDRLWARRRVYLLETERARRKALDAIAERDALRLARRDAARRACFIQGVSHGPWDAELGPREDETLSAFGARVDRETPRLTLADFSAPPAWWDREESSPWAVPGSMPALPNRERASK